MNKQRPDLTGLTEEQSNYICYLEGKIEAYKEVLATRRTVVKKPSEELIIDNKKEPNDIFEPTNDHTPVFKINVNAFEERSAALKEQFK